MGFGFGLKLKVKSLVRRFLGESYLFFPCSQSNKIIVRKQAQLLNSLFDISLNPELMESGHALLEAGFITDFKKLRAKNLGLIDNKVITNCANCLHVFRKYYKIEAYHYIELLNRFYNKLIPKVNNACLVQTMDDIIYGLNVKASNLLRNIGVDLKTINCYGSEGLLLEVFPNIAKALSTKTLKNLKDNKCKNIVVLSPKPLKLLRTIVKLKNLKLNIHDLSYIIEI